MQPKKRLKKAGKHAKLWAETRRRWIEQNPYDLYNCWICARDMTPGELTLDHVKSRSRHPELRYVLGNLQPCCWDCNTEKGSREYDPETGRYA